MVAIVALVFPFIFNDYLVRAATTIIMLAILAESWNLIGGYAGYPSFGHAVFFGLGVYGAPFRWSSSASLFQRDSSSEASWPPWSRLQSACRFCACAATTSLSRRSEF